MTIIRVSPSTALVKRTATPQATAQLPTEWQAATYAPGYPIQPLGESSWDERTLPREIDYPLAVNASLQPRTGYGHMPFAALLSAYESIPEVRMPVQIILREITGFIPRLIDDEGDDVTKHHPYRWLTVSPDKSSPYDIWMTRLLKSAYVYDAGAVYIEEQGGNLNGLHYIDGSTLFIMVDEHGRVPAPTDISTDPKILAAYVQRAKQWQASGRTLPLKTPAYAQVIKGTPFSWYAQDEVWYKPRSRRLNSPYGESFIEQSWAWIILLANIVSFEIAHYREGNMPEGWFESPPDWTLERVAAFELANNYRMTSGPSERMRSRFYPSGFKWHETKKAEFPAKLYETARDAIFHTIGVPTTEIGKVPGQGLGGKGFQQAMESALFRNALVPAKTYVEGLMNDMLARYGVDEVHFELALPTSPVDPADFQKNIIDQFSAGMLTLNEALSEIGRNPVEGGDVHIIISGGGTVFILEDYLKEENRVPEGGAPPQGQGQAADDRIIHPGPVPQQNPDQQKPSGPWQPRIQEKPGTHADISQTDLSSDRPKPDFSERSLARAIEILESGNYRRWSSIPAKVLRKDDKNPIDIGRELGVDFNAIDPKQFAIGYDEECGEHGGLESQVIVQLVVDHLTENPDYYKGKSPKDGKSVLEKHCGVCPEDAQYYRAPVIREATMIFPHDGHANDVEIVVMTPKGLEPKPALWKPEGGEADILRQNVGGPLYPREEAAWLIDQSLGFALVPVTYVAEVDNEFGAVIYYTHDLNPAPTLVTDYATQWLEKAAVFDYVTGQVDRGTKHNHAGHPDDPERPILFDNGYAFPDRAEMTPQSIFCANYLGKPLSDEVKLALMRLHGDEATWADVINLIGSAPTGLCQARILKLLEDGCIKPPESIT